MEKTLRFARLPVLKRISIIIIVLSFSQLTGCNFSNRADYPEEELIVYGGIDGATYEYSNKVRVTVYADNGNHMELILKCYKNDDKEWDGTGYVVFKDLKFTHFAWNNYYLYIQTVNNTFYSLDIKNYNPGEFVDRKKRIPKYSLIELTSNEFEEENPDYKTYEWLNG